MFAEKKGNNAANNNDFDYFAALKIKIPKGVTVSANQVKQELEIQIEIVLLILAKAL